MSQKQVDIQLTLERPMTAGELVALVLECYYNDLGIRRLAIRHDLKNAQNTVPGTLIQGLRVVGSIEGVKQAKTVSAPQSKKPTRKGKA